MPIVTRYLFLVAGLLDLVLLLSGFVFGPNLWAQGGIILAIGIFICGAAVNFFMEPWTWMVLFLLLSPLSGGMYLFFTEFPFTLSSTAHQVTIDWHLFFGYLFLCPLAAMLFGAVGPRRSRRELMAASFTKRLTLTVWCLGGSLVLAGFGIPFVSNLGLAWMLASAFLAIAQLIQLKQAKWLGSMMFSLAFMGLPIFFWGFAYGAFGPTESKESFGDFF